MKKISKEFAEKLKIEIGKLIDETIVCEGDNKVRSYSTIYYTVEDNLCSIGITTEDYGIIISTKEPGQKLGFKRDCLSINFWETYE